MTKAVIVALIGSAITFMYLEGDITGWTDAGKKALNEGAQVIVEQTSD